MFPLRFPNRCAFPGHSSIYFPLPPFTCFHFLFDVANFKTFDPLHLFTLKRQVQDQKLISL
jgi:hypothetical protein